MFFSFLLTLVSGISLMILVLTISLLLIGGENVLYDIQQGTDGSVFAPYRRFLAGRCADRCPPPLLYASCLCLLIIFLFIPMGSFPQFVETEGDIIAIVFLLLAAQGLYIRGMKAFSGEIYQSFDPRELFVLSKFAVTLIAAGGTLSRELLDSPELLSRGGFVGTETQELPQLVPSLRKALRPEEGEGELVAEIGVARLRPDRPFEKFDRLGGSIGSMLSGTSKAVWLTMQLRLS